MVVFKNFHSVRIAQSLVFKLIAIGVTLVVVGSVVRYRLIQSTVRDGITQVVHAQQLSMAHYVAEDIDAKVVARRQLLEMLANELPREDMTQPQAMQRWLQSNASLLSLFTFGVVVIPADGKGALADFPPLPQRRTLDFNDRDWFRTAHDQSLFAIGKPGIGRAAKEAVVNMAVPILNEQKQVIGVLMGVTALNSPGFLDLVQKSMVGATGSLLLISPRDKLFVTASDTAMRLQPTPDEGVNLLHDKAMAGWRGTGIAVNAGGVEELSAVVGVPSAGWFLVVRTPSEEVFHTVDRLLDKVLVSSVVLSGLLIIFLVLLLTRMFKPLTDSAAQMRAMARGQAELETLPLVRHDEVGSMVKSFNELVLKLRQSQVQMSYLAQHDPLTGLPNRMAFKNNMAQSIALAQRQDGSLAVLFIDLDGFKMVNDTYGHDMGDWLLQQVATRLRECVRASDIVGRMGGDEFVLLLTDNPQAQEALHIAQKAVDCVSAPYQKGDTTLRIGASIGIALYPGDADAADPLLVLADSAMYVAKRGGGHRIHLSGMLN